MLKKREWAYMSCLLQLAEPGPWDLAHIRAAKIVERVAHHGVPTRCI